jgi:hypothetical protein
MNKGNTKHGLKKTRTYSIWGAMKTRCYNKNQPAYKQYGARGVHVCKRWKKSFENFYNDMGPCPQGHSIDRIDNNGNYEPSNCRWATRSQQNNNTNSNRIIIINNVKFTAAEAAVKFNINYFTLIYRMNKGWTTEQVVYGKNGNR